MSDTKDDGGARVPAEAAALGTVVLMFVTALIVGCFVSAHYREQLANREVEFSNFRLKHVEYVARTAPGANPPKDGKSTVPDEPGNCDDPVFVMLDLTGEIEVRARQPRRWKETGYGEFAWGKLAVTRLQNEPLAVHWEVDGKDITYALPAAERDRLTKLAREQFKDRLAKQKQAQDRKDQEDLARAAKALLGEKP